MAAQAIAALDIGGTKLAVTVANQQGPLLRVSQPTIREGSADAIPLQALQLLDTACLQAGISRESCTALGVSSCGPFAHRDGLIDIIPPNLCGGLVHSDDLPNDWTSIPLERVLRSQFSEVCIANDCVAALIGERHFGAAQQEPNCAYVTWSTGIGFGLCVDGHILQGKAGNAGHAGHMLLSDVSDALCGCGNRGDLEGMIAGRNLSNRLGQPLADVFLAAQRGDAAAMDVVRDAARWFGRGLYNLVTTLDLKLILVGGSVWRHHAPLLQPLVHSEIISRFPALTNGVTVINAELDELVTDIGALAMVMPDEWKTDWQLRRPWHQLRSVTPD